MSLIPGIAYDHPDIYPTQDEYNDAFKDFLAKSEYTVLWQSDAAKLDVHGDDKTTVLGNNTDLSHITLVGHVNRINAHLTVVGLEKLGLCTYEQGVDIMNRFPGVSRRFEKLVDNLYTDYAHTPEKISGALQLAKEVAGENVVVVYEGLHNTRQHFIREQLTAMFDGIKKLYVVPSYKARENKSLEDLTPEKLVSLMKAPDERISAQLDSQLKQHIEFELSEGNLVLCLTAGGGGSLDEWLRKEF
jgi:UDP-N-acetylmuramate--alanine ligase